MRPEFKRHFLGPVMTQTIERREMWTQSVNSMAPQASSAIMTNNLAVTFTVFAAGITAGLGTLYMIVWNGVLLGVIATACHQAHMSIKLWSFVAPHGSLELPAIIIAGGAGLRLAYGLLFPGIYSRRHSLFVAGSESVRLVSGVVPMLIVAGILEGFLSPSAAPVWLKFVTAFLLFTLLVLWLWSTPSQLGYPGRSGVAWTAVLPISSRDEVHPSSHPEPERASGGSAVPAAMHFLVRQSAHREK